MRSQQAERAFTDVGSPDVRVLPGEIARWQTNGRPVDRGRDSWDLERPVRFAASSILLAAKIGSLIVPRATWLSTAVGGGCLAPR